MTRGRPAGPAELVLAAAALLAAGCSFGPRALEQTHGRYAESVRRVDEEQLLRHIVHLRYNEAPGGVDVTSIAAQYELAAGAEARPFFVAPNPGSNPFRTFAAVLPDATLTGSTRPTISLVPTDDGASVRRFLTPVSLDTLVFLTQTSWPVGTIMRVWVERLNGVPNAVAASGPGRDGPVDFERFLHIAELLQAAQDRELGAVRTEDRLIGVGGPFPADAVGPTAAVEAARSGLEYRPDAGGRTASLVRRERRLVLAVTPGAEGAPEVAELTRLLNLVSGRRTYDLVIAARGGPDPARFPTPPATEVRVVPRSTSQALFYLSNGVDVPAAHVCAGLVPPMTTPDGRPCDRPEITRGLFAVHTCEGHNPPANAYLAIRYRGYWYYVDDRDRETKATFALMLALSRLDFARQQLGAGPVLTLPAGR